MSQHRDRFVAFRRATVHLGALLRTSAAPPRRTECGGRALMQEHAAGKAPAIVETGSPDWIVSWAELEALAQQLAIMGQARGLETTALQGQPSQREIEVLRYLPSVLTAGEIGAELCISVNTVKAHLRSIYRRLGVTRRRDAVVQAHHYGFLQGPFSPDADPIE